MPDQEPLIPAGAGGLYRRVLAAGTINHAAWLRARAEGLPVGSCRRCGADLVPEAPRERPGGRFDYEAVCRDAKCGAVLAAPGGRAMRGSTAWSKAGGAPARRPRSTGRRPRI